MFSFPDAGRFLGAQPVLLNPAFHASGASLDSRSLVAGNLFIALRGSLRDGHEYLEEAFRRGASGALIDRSVFDSNPGRFLSRPELFHNLLPVPDAQKALADLACWHRSRFSIPAIGITGSAGKTSTKDFLDYLLQKKFSVLATSGNFNNHLGLPLTLLRFDDSYQVCVAELGANHQGEISYLSGLLKPTGAIITQISPAHLEGFGSLEAIYQAKLELFEALPPKAIAVLPDDDPHLIEKAHRLDIKLILVGMTDEADYRISQAVLENGMIHFKVNEKKIVFPGFASFFARNAAMAMAMADSLGYSLDEIPENWSDLKLSGGRFESLTAGNSVRIIYDGYNANPSSFEKALEAFHMLPVTGRKILVFADMLELGEEEMKYHRLLGERIADFAFDCVAAYGERAKFSIRALYEKNLGLWARHFSDAEEVYEFLRSFIKAGDCILLKASRGMKIEQVLNLLNQPETNVSKSGSVCTI